MKFDAAFFASILDPPNGSATDPNAVNRPLVSFILFLPIILSSQIVLQKEEEEIYFKKS
jgi:hypothetical protein